MPRNISAIHVRFLSYRNFTFGTRILKRSRKTWQNKNSIGNRHGKAGNMGDILFIEADEEINILPAVDWQATVEGLPLFCGKLELERKTVCKTHNEARDLLSKYSISKDLAVAVRFLKPDKKKYWLAAVVL